MNDMGDYLWEKVISFDGDTRAAVHWFYAMWQMERSLWDRGVGVDFRDPEADETLTLLPGLTEEEVSLIAEAFEPESLVLASDELKITLWPEDGEGLVRWDGAEQRNLRERMRGGVDLPPVRLVKKSAVRLSNRALADYLQREPAFAGVRIRAWYLDEPGLSPYRGDDERILLLAATAPGGGAVLLHFTGAQKLVIAARQEISLPQLNS